MILQILICVIVLGVVTYYQQNRLAKTIQETVEEYGKVFSNQDIFNLKMLLIPFSGCLLLIILWIVEMYNFWWNNTMKWIVLAATAIADFVLGYVYIKICNNANRNFADSGKKLFLIVKLYSFAPIAIGVGLLLFLLSIGFRIPFFWLVVACMIATFIPVFKNYPPVRMEFSKALSSYDPETTVVSAGQRGEEKPTKRCPYCGEEILAVAKKCKHCGEWLINK